VVNRVPTIRLVHSLGWVFEAHERKKERVLTKVLEVDPSDGWGEGIEANRNLVLTIFKGVKIEPVRKKMVFFIQNENPQHQHIQKREIV